MLDFYYEPSEQELKDILKRDRDDDEKIRESVIKIMEDVKERGDEALFYYSKKFDSSDLDSLYVKEAEIEDSANKIPSELKDAIDQAAANIRAFHEKERAEGEVCETMPGVVCRRKIVPISKPGLYVPGGTAPLFSTVLMLAIPAKIAGCRDIMLATPCKNGSISPAILYSAKVAGVDSILKVGGAQAIAAFAYGTKSVEKRNKIFGPGNRFVSYAKIEASKNVSIDMLAGPSEVMVVADKDSNPLFIATDLLSQAEHGSDSQAMLAFIGSKEDAEIKKDEVYAEVNRLLNVLPRSSFMKESLSKSRIIAFSDTKRAMYAVNMYAPEHLIINTKNYNELLDMVESAGSVFLGPYSSESAGDYASGTNHTLPTSGFASSLSGVSLDSFIKKITVQELSKEGVNNIAKTVMTMAKAEGLEAHSLAMQVRL